MAAAPCLPSLIRPRRSAVPPAAAVSLRAASPRARSGAPRRIVLGLGAALLDTMARMASSSVGGRSFTASARPRQGTSPVEQVFPPSNPPGVCTLDLCSSWVSHYPPGYKQSRVVGMGMNEEELKRNPVLTEYIVQDLNVNPKLPFDDNSFDVITNVVSVDYLTKPLDVFKEMNWILKPGGLAIMSLSNRCFWTKAISIWTSTGDADHVLLVGSYFHYAGGFEPPSAVDISPNPGRSDPMYVVYSRKKSTEN